QIQGPLLRGDIHPPNLPIGSKAEMVLHTGVLSTFLPRPQKVSHFGVKFRLRLNRRQNPFVAQLTLQILETDQNISLKALGSQFSTKGEVACLVLEFAEAFHHGPDGADYDASVISYHCGECSPCTKALESIAALSKTECGFLHGKALSNGGIQFSHGRLAVRPRNEVIWHHEPLNVQTAHRFPKNIGGEYSPFGWRLQRHVESFQRMGSAKCGCSSCSSVTPDGLVGYHKQVESRTLVHEFLNNLSGGLLPCVWRHSGFRLLHILTRRISYFVIAAGGHGAFLLICTQFWDSRLSPADKCVFRCCSGWLTRQ